MTGYLAKILRLGLRIPRGEVRVLTVLHERWCTFRRTGNPVDCDCNPDLRLGPDLVRGDS